LLTLAAPAAVSAVAPADRRVPRFDHVIVIVEENKDAAEILFSNNAPTLKRLAQTYGLASNFYGEVHPSEGNYVAMISGDTYGIHDDDAFYCRPHLFDLRHCPYSLLPGYANHTINALQIGDQLERVHLTWKGYFENIPSSGSLAPSGSDTPGQNVPFYASKHNGFLNFRSIQTDAVRRAAHLVGFSELAADLQSGRFPNFAFIVPNQCNEMHGMITEQAGCNWNETPALIARGDRAVKSIIDDIMRSSVWRGKQRTAIVITFDEAEGRTSGYCCGSDPKSRANFGGGKIATIVMTNHGPRHVVDATPYNHYSLLRTIEDAFGIHTYLGHAADFDKGVLPMSTLFGP